MQHRLQARVAARASGAAIKALMEATDAVAEIQNTLQSETPVRLAEIEAVPV